MIVYFTFKSFNVTAEETFTTMKSNPMLLLTAISKIVFIDFKTQGHILEHSYLQHTQIIVDKSYYPSKIVGLISFIILSVCLFACLFVLLTKDLNEISSYEVLYSVYLLDSISNKVNTSSTECKCQYISGNYFKSP